VPVALIVSREVYLSAGGADSLPSVQTTSVRLVGPQPNTTLPGG